MFWVITQSLLRPDQAFREDFVFSWWAAGLFLLIDQLLFDYQLWEYGLLQKPATLITVRNSQFPPWFLACSRLYNFNSKSMQQKSWSYSHNYIKYHKTSTQLKKTDHSTNNSFVRKQRSLSPEAKKLKYTYIYNINISEIVSLPQKEGWFRSKI